MRTQLRLLVPLFVAAAAVGVLPAHAITNPRPDNGEHPFVGLFVFDRGGQPWSFCSGSLISATVFLTAGHCTVGATGARVWFSENVEGNDHFPYGGPTAWEGTPYTIPGFCEVATVGGCGEPGRGLPDFIRRDVGVVVLDRPVPRTVVAEYAELPPPMSVDLLPNKTPIDLVGYGAQKRLCGGGPPVWDGFEVRNQADVQLIASRFEHSAEFLRVTANPGQGKGGMCFGDSGGPNLSNGGRTVYGVNSYAIDSNCTGMTYSQRVDLPSVQTWINSFR